MIGDNGTHKPIMHESAVFVKRELVFSLLDLRAYLYYNAIIPRSLEQKEA